MRKEVREKRRAEELSKEGHTRALAACHHTQRQKDCLATGLMERLPWLAIKHLLIKHRKVCINPCH